MRLARSVVLAIVIVAGGAAPPAAQAQADDDAVWRGFVTWFKAAPAAGDPFSGYGAALKAEGVPPDEVQRRLQVLGRLIGQRSDWIEIYFDKVFSRPVTGNPARDGFSAAPSPIVVDAISGVRPGMALDAGMGQGRNAIHLARQGWTVTGFDISAEAVAAARQNALGAGVTLDAIKASYETFDFGTSKWDLVVFAFAWAPVSDPDFVSKVRASLKPGGRVVFEHFVDDPAQPRPPAVRALKPGQLRELFKDFLIERYEEVDGIGDWGGPGSRLVRMIAARRDTNVGVGAEPRRDGFAPA